MFTPKDFDKARVGNYMKFEDGENKIRVLEEPITGYVYWEDVNGDIVPKNEMAGKGGKPIRSQTYDALNMAQRGAMKGFAAVLVWNYNVGKVQILEIKQVGIMNALEALSLSKAWGDIKTFNIIVKRTRTGSNPTDVEYSVIPEPKEELDKEISKTYKEAKVNLNALYDGDDPFGNEEEAVDVEEVAKEITDVDIEEVMGDLDGKVN